MSLADLLPSQLCWHCGDPLGDEPSQPVLDAPGWLAHDECAHQYDDTQEITRC